MFEEGRQWWLVNVEHLALRAGQLIDSICQYLWCKYSHYGDLNYQWLNNGLSKFLKI